MKCFLSLSLLFLSVSISYAETLYWDRYSGFAPFACTNDTALIIHNETFSPIKNVIPADLNDFDSQFEARVKNVNNKHNKKYLYRDENGNKESVKYPAWGVVAIGNDCDTILIRVKTSTSTDWEYTASDCLELTAFYNDSIVASGVAVYPDIAPFTGENTIRVTRKGSRVSVGMGERYVKECISFTIDDFDVSAVGFIVMPGAKIDIVRASLEYTVPADRLLKTAWTEASIADYLAKSTDPLEGYWAYLDRSLDENLLRMGGDYTCALVRNAEGYDLIYLTGAAINSEEWQPGMIKAQLMPTKFGGVYNLTWYDSQMKPLSKDITMQFENGALATISFPYQTSALRMHRVHIDK